MAKRKSRRNVRSSRRSRSSRQRSGNAIAELVGFGRKALQRFDPRPLLPATHVPLERVQYRGYAIDVAPMAEKRNTWEASMLVPMGPWRKTTYVYVHGKSREQALCAARARIDRVLCRE